MEEKEFETEEISVIRSKNIFQRIFTNKKFIISASIILIFFVFEFTTDFVEIVLGKVIELTNPLRPKAGTIWEMNKKDQIANSRLKEITKNIPSDKTEIHEINDIKQLSNLLQAGKTVFLTPEQFRNLYNQIPPRFSFDIISPFDLLKLAHSRKWRWTKIIKTENNLSFYFLDGDRQLLMDTYPPLTVLFNSPQSNDSNFASLDSIANFQGRTFSRAQFFEAFDDLSNALKIQLINNPYELIKWENSIRKVGISRYAIDDVVSIGFEVQQNIYTEVITFEASELAANYLISRLNEFNPGLTLEYAEKKYREYHYYDF